MMASSADFVKHKKDGDVSSVWSHFLVSLDGKSGKCKVCKAVLKTLGGSTKGLHVHLSSKHDTKIKAALDQASTSQLTSTENEPSTKRQKITDYLTTADTMDTILARMTALDGLPFSVFVTSVDLRNLFLAKGYSLPKSASTIQSKVMNYSLQVRSKIKAELKRLKSEGERFSLTFDEWTSHSNKRYMNINIHSRNKFWSLGLVRVKMSLTAENCKVLLEERLALFEKRCFFQMHHLQKQGGSRLTEKVRLAMNEIVTPELAAEMCLRGKTVQKIQFSSTPLCDVVLEMLESKFTSRDAEYAIGEFFRNAPAKLKR